MHVCFAWGIGGGEMVVIMAAILVLFGAKRIPEFAKGLGRAMHEFNKAKSEVTQELHNAMEEDRYRAVAAPKVQESIAIPSETAPQLENSSPSPNLAQNHPPATVPKT